MRNYLGHAGYDYASSYDAIRQLEDEGIVEIYDRQGEGHLRPVRAIRLKKRNPDFYGYRPFENLQEKLEESYQEPLL